MFNIILIVFLLRSESAFRITGTEYSVKFIVANAGFDVEGTMKINSAQIDFDPNNLHKSQVRISADPSSVKTGIGVRDKHLLRSDYFDTEHYPEILIQSKGFVKTGEDKFEGRFDLTIKSITKEVTIPFSRNKKGDTIAYDAKFEINRLDFKIGEESLTLSETVRIEFGDFRL